MKKIILSMLVLLVMLWCVNPVLARRGGQSGRGRDRNADRQKQQTKETAEKDAERGRSKVEAEKQRASKGEAKKKEKQAAKEKAKGKAPEKSTAKGKSTSNIGKGKGQQQSIKALKKQMLHEEAKYRKRQAHFKRIRELATKKGNTAILERLKVLEQKEKSRYESKRKRMTEMMRQLETGEGKSLQDTADKSAARQKGKAKTEAEKEKEKVKAGKNKATE